MIFQVDSLPEIERIEESPIIIEGKVEGWHVTSFGSSGPLGAGFGIDRSIAQRIAIAESAERILVNRISESDLYRSFLLDDFPTTCGFAAGFENESTRRRSLSEAIERWCWSKWMDEGYFVPEIKVEDTKLDLLSLALKKDFAGIKYYQCVIDASNLFEFGLNRELLFSVVVASSNTGVFVGSRVATVNENPWQHSILEAWRHQKIFKSGIADEADVFPFQRIKYFGSNSEAAFAQIKRANNKNWEVPRPRLVINFDTKIEGLFLWRSIMENYVGWHCGAESRFVY